MGSFAVVAAMEAFRVFLFIYVMRLGCEETFCFWLYRRFGARHKREGPSFTWDYAFDWLSIAEI